MNPHGFFMILKRPLFVILLLIMNSLAINLAHAQSSSALKLRPHIRFEELPCEYTLDFSAIKPFIKDSLIMQNDEVIATAPYVIALGHEHNTASTGDKIFACGIKNLTEQLYTIYKPNRFYIHPITKECLGYEAEAIGTAKVNVIDKVSELEILSAREGVEIKAKLLPTYVLPPLPDFTLHKATTLGEGYILSVKEGKDYIGRNHVVVISMGCREGLQEGDVLDIFQTSSGWSFCSACPIHLTDNKIGKALIFRAYDKLSLALIIEATDIINILDQVRSPI